MAEHFEPDSELLNDICGLKYTTDINAVGDLELKGWRVLMTFGPFENGILGTLLGQPKTEEARRMAALEAEAAMLREKNERDRAEAERQRAELEAEIARLKAIGSA